MGRVSTDARKMSGTERLLLGVPDCELSAWTIYESGVLSNPINCDCGQIVDGYRLSRKAIHMFLHEYAADRSTASIMAKEFWERYGRKYRLVTMMHYAHTRDCRVRWWADSPSLKLIGDSIWDAGGICPTPYHKCRKWREAVWTH